MSPNPAKAPWYFAGFQELLLHFDPLVAVVVLPLSAALFLFALPYLRYDKDASGILLMSREGRRLALAAVIVAAVVTPLWILADEYVIDLAAWLPALPPAVRNGLLPAIVCAAVVVAFHAVARRRAGANNEAVQASFVLLATAFLILTVAGVWFRGAGMALVWPWAR
jgi:quinol-cytochrome oxidoreductase complex cytochrome b subunit